MQISIKKITVEVLRVDKDGVVLVVNSKYNGGFEKKQRLTIEEGDVVTITRTEN